MYTALLTYGAFAVPHLAFHAAHPATGLSTSARGANLALLSSGLVLAVLLAWWARPEAPSTSPPPTVVNASDRLTSGRSVT